MLRGGGIMEMKDFQVSIVLRKLKLAERLF